jgi:WD40 repeat protein
MRGQDRVYSAAFSPDGTRVVTASFDGTARIWDGGDTLGTAGIVLASGCGSPSKQATENFAITAKAWATLSAGNSPRRWPG